MISKKIIFVLGLILSLIVIIQFSVVVYTVNDIISGNSQAEVELRVISRNAPIIENPGNLTIYFDTEFNYIINVTDLDGQVPIIYSNSTLFTINNITGLINFTPNSSQEGNYTILVWAIDDHYNTSIEFTIKIIDGDLDNDGVVDTEDLCLGTAIPESVPYVELTPNNYAAIDNDTYLEKKLSNGSIVNGYLFTETYGCSCEQILAIKPGNDNGQLNYGCTEGTMNVWINQLGWSPIIIPPSTGGGGGSGGAPPPEGYLKDKKQEKDKEITEQELQERIEKAKKKFTNCYNNNKDSGESNVDCGGGCRSCHSKDTGLSGLWTGGIIELGVDEKDIEEGLAMLNEVYDLVKEEKWLEAEAKEKEALILIPEAELINEECIDQKISKQKIEINNKNRNQLADEALKRATNTRSRREIDNRRDEIPLTPATVNIDKCLKVFDITRAGDKSHMAYRSKFEIKVSADNDLQNVKVVETIDKKAAKHTDEIEFNKKPEILQEDPIVMWTIPYLEKDEIEYFEYLTREEVSSLEDSITLASSASVRLDQEAVIGEAFNFAQYTGFCGRVIPLSLFVRIVGLISVLLVGLMYVSEKKNKELEYLTKIAVVCALIDLIINIPCPQYWYITLILVLSALISYILWKKYENRNKK